MVTQREKRELTVFISNFREFDMWGEHRTYQLWVQSGIHFDVKYAWAFETRIEGSYFTFRVFVDATPFAFMKRKDIVSVCKEVVSYVHRNGAKRFFEMEAVI